MFRRPFKMPKFNLATIAGLFAATFSSQVTGFYKDPVRHVKGARKLSEAEQSRRHAERYPAMQLHPQIDERSLRHWTKNKGRYDNHFMKGIYVGPNTELIGNSALLRRNPDMHDTCYAQFDRLGIPESHGWHLFRFDDFTLTT